MMISSTLPAGTFQLSNKNSFFRQILTSLTRARKSDENWPFNALNISHQHELSAINIKIHGHTLTSHFSLSSLSFFYDRAPLRRRSQSRFISLQRVKLLLFVFFMSSHVFPMMRLWTLLCGLKRSVTFIFIQLTMIGCIINGSIHLLFVHLFWHCMRSARIQLNSHNSMQATRDEFRYTAARLLCTTSDEASLKVHNAVQH